MDNNQSKFVHASVLYVFTSLNGFSYQINIFDSWSDIHNQNFIEVVAPKNKNTYLKLIRKSVREYGKPFVTL